MRRYAALILLLCCYALLHAQFDAQTSFYTFFESTYNPAAAGQGTQLIASGSYRLQWVGIENAPRTAYFQAQLPLKLGKTEHGIGVRFMNDKLGLFTNQTFYTQYAYKKALRKGCLSAGVEIGFVGMTFSGDSVHIPSQGEYHIEADEKIPRQESSAMKLDMGLGVYYTSQMWQLGVSYSHLTRPVVSLTDYSDFTIFGTMYITMGTNIYNHSKTFAFKPNILFRTDFATWTLDMTALMEFKRRFQGGFSYRWGDAVGLLFSARLVGGLSIGYAYELPLSKVLQASSGSHEAYISYAIDIYKQKHTSKYKSVRIL